MPSLRDELLPSEAELSDLFTKTLGQAELISERERELLLAWETKVRKQVLESFPAPVGEPHQWKLPDERRAMTHRFQIPTDDAPFKGYLTMGMYPDGRLGELFLSIAKEGSFVSGIMDALMFTLSIALQHGVPLELFTKRFRHTKFLPAGIVSGAPKEIQGFSGSVLDYLGNFLSLRFPGGTLDEATVRKKKEKVDK